MILKKNDYVYQNGEKAKYIYFVKSGEIEVHIYCMFYFILLD